MDLAYSEAKFFTFLNAFEVSDLTFGGKIAKWKLINIVKNPFGHSKSKKRDESKSLD
jgi:hypothetical protein